MAEKTTDELVQQGMVVFRLVRDKMRLRDTVRALLDAYPGETPCHLDHEGYCQEHAVSAPCVVAAARMVLEETAPRKDSFDGL
jgi:hypothetical protein